jgi:hypothetical protein
MRDHQAEEVAVRHLGLASRHQEIVKGVYTSTPAANLALLELAHWYEVIFILGFVVLFWRPAGGCGGPARRHLRA